MSASDHSLLSALFDPSTSLQATATAHGLSLLGLACWLAQPHIQAQVELIESLLALHRQVWADQLRQEAADALREALRHAPDPAERRRCAHTLLRAIATPRATSLPRAASQAVPARSPAPTAATHEATHTPPTQPEAPAWPTPPLDASMPSSLDASAPSSLDASIPSSLDPSPSPYHQALATLRACGHDTTEDELTDDQLDALEDAEADALEDPEFDDEFDAGLDARLYEYPANLTGSGIAQALTLADGRLVAPHDTS